MSRQPTNKGSKNIGGVKIRIRKFNYEAFAKWAGRNAYRRAIENGLPEEVAREFQKICGAPVPAECRFS